MTTHGIRRLAASALGVVAMGAASAPALASTGETEVPTFQQFRASTFQDLDKQYIVNGDEVVPNDGELHEFYDQVVGAQHSTPKDGLVVNTVNGTDDVWSASQVGNLTYCVSTKFGTDHDAIVEAMEGGAALWESASSAVDFVHVPAQDGSCTTRNRSVVFSVEPVRTNQYIARAFFPSSPKTSRNVLVDDSIWTSGSWTPANVLGHELGHTLGFRHEHTRPEAGTCFEDTSWRPLTPYDSVSIMHYPQCNGGSENLEFSSYDRQGVQAVYGS